MTPPAQPPAKPMQLTDDQVMRQLHEGCHKLLAQIHLAVVGQDRVIQAVLCSMIAGGHCLVQGVPGLAKTLLVHSIADALHLSFKRIQFTPDLMPSDITGTDILQEDPETSRRRYEFIQGPIFANLVLADEINRTPPKTQAALLQAMQEREVTASGRTYALDAPFFILATQNPIEQEGTYPLPEAALDRFMFMVHIDYPSAEEEHQIIKLATTRSKPVLKPVLHKDDIVMFQKLVHSAPVSDAVIDYSVHLARATRPLDPLATEMVKKYFKWGAGPRASLYMVLGAKAWALLSGRVTASFDDVRRVAKMVLRHRVITNFDAEADGISNEDVIDDLLRRIAPPK